MLRIDGGGQGHRIIALVGEFVGGVAQQPVTGVAGADLGDVQLLAAAPIGPPAVPDPVGPRHQDHPAAHRRNPGVVPDLGEMGAVETELAEHRGHLPHLGRRPTAAQHELLTGGRARAGHLVPGRYVADPVNWDNARPNCKSRCIWASPPSVTDLENR